MYNTPSKEGALHHPSPEAHCCLLWKRTRGSGCLPWRKIGPLLPCWNDSIFEPPPVGAISTLSQEVLPCREDLLLVKAAGDMCGSEWTLHHSNWERDSLNRASEQIPPCLLILETAVVLSVLIRACWPIRTGQKCFRAKNNMLATTLHATSGGWCETCVVPMSRPPSPTHHHTEPLCPSGRHLWTPPYENRFSFPADLEPSKEGESTCKTGLSSASGDNMAHTAGEIESSVETLPSLTAWAALQRS